jgi:hypothetical protein
MKEKVKWLRDKLNRMQKNQLIIVDNEEYSLPYF